MNILTIVGQKVFFYRMPKKKANTFNIFYQEKSTKYLQRYNIINKRSISKILLTEKQMYIVLFTQTA